MNITLEEAYNLIPKEVKTVFIEAANYVLNNSKFTGWNEQKMKTQLRKRSLDTIVNSREINHLFPCADAAALATKYLTEKGEKVSIKFLTERGAVDAFRQGKSRAMHIDTITELFYQGVSYGLDIGCGDLTLFKPISGIEKFKEEEAYITTRPEEHERIWKRTPFLKIDGKTLIQNSSRQMLDLMDTASNLSTIPYSLKKSEFHTFPQIEGKESFLTTNEEYDPNASSSDNKIWLSIHQKFLPGLTEYKYER